MMRQIKERAEVQARPQAVRRRKAARKRRGAVRDLSEDRRSEPDSRAWRGVFVAPWPEKVISRKQITIRVSALPRLKPEAVIDRRTLDRASDA